MNREEKLSLKNIFEIHLFLSHYPYLIYFLIYFHLISFFLQGLWEGGGGVVGREKHLISF